MSFKSHCKMSAERARQNLRESEYDRELFDARARAQRFCRIMEAVGTVVLIVAVAAVLIAGCAVFE